MRLYLDEDMVNAHLVRLLERAGHDVQTANSAGMRGRSDPVQLTHAIQGSRVCLSANYDDYEELHLLIAASQGNHPGILVVRQENNPARDMTPKGIVAAIRKLEAAGVPVANEYVVLNHWR
jgi:predicted nuclease of predicted toxin-antitoxin system